MVVPKLLGGVVASLIVIVIWEGNTFIVGGKKNIVTCPSISIHAEKNCRVGG